MPQGQNFRVTVTRRNRFGGNQEHVATGTWTFRETLQLDGVPESVITAIHSFEDSKVPQPWGGGNLDAIDGDFDYTIAAVPVEG